MVTLVKLWNRQVLASPDVVAVIAGDERVTFTELDERASVLAQLLRARGVGPESLVGVCVDRSVNLVVALLGILKAGGAYLPLDPTYPAARLRYLVADSGVRLVLCDSREAERSPISSEDVKFFAVDRLRLVAETGRVAPKVRPENLAYVIYTSGITGRPTGVAITHASIGSFLRDVARKPGVAAGDRVLGLTPLSFDGSALEIFLPLTVGACVVLAPAGANTDPEVLAATIKDHGVTVVQATPPTWRTLVESGWAKTQVYLVDEQGRQVPPGGVGELWIGGIGVARGFLGRPGLTAERFLPDPWGPAGGRVYRTGDLARFLPDGRLEVVGRAEPDRPRLESIDTMEVYGGLSGSDVEILDNTTKSMAIGLAHPVAEDLYRDVNASC